MPDYPYLPLEDLVIEVIDRRGVTPRKLGSDFTAEGYRVISARTIRNRTVDLAADDERYVSEEVYRRWMKTPLRAGDVLLTSEAPLGEPAYVQKAQPWVVGQRLFAIRTDPLRLMGRFLFYAVQSDWVREDILSRATGTTVLGIRQSELRRVRIPVPSLADQEAIVEVLGALDDKIELNRRLSETLDEVARTQFNATFLGAKSSLSTESQQVPVQNFFEILSGGTPKTSEPEYWGGPIPWFSVADTPPGSSTFVLETAKTVTERGIETSPAQVVPAWTTIISARGTVGKLAMAGVPLAFNQSCYGLRATNGAGPSFVYLLANHIVEKLQALSHGSVFSTITRRTFDAVQFPSSSSETLTAFEDRVAPLYQRILVATRESATLAELRDALLPKLISGELRLPEAEKLVSEVA